MVLLTNSFIINRLINTKIVMNKRLYKPSKNKEEIIKNAKVYIFAQK